MSKTILLTGATDGIGLLTAEKLVKQGHKVLIHGRNAEKLSKVKEKLSRVKEKLCGLESEAVEIFCADFSNLTEVSNLGKNLLEKYSHIDVVINNAGIYKTDTPITADNMDVRFVVNTLAPYLLSKLLLPIMDNTSRIINLSSAAQAPVDLEALAGKKHIEAQFDAYAQSKLAITMWSRHLADTLGNKGPIIIAVNPGSLLASKMVKEGFGVEGKDINIGADILIRTSLDDEFLNASGLYFDNDVGSLSSPHIDALDTEKCKALVDTLESIVENI